MKYQESINLLKELDLYLTRLKEYPNFEEKEKAILEFQSIYESIKNSIKNNEPWDVKRNKCLKIRDFFRHGMGSKWEYIPEELSKNIDSLVYASHNFLKLCYKQEGNKIFNIDKNELFKVGDKVYLVQNELMYLDDNGNKEFVDIVTRYIYEIKRVLSTDISNMPLYLIEVDNFSRVVRHNAIKKFKSK